MLERNLIEVSASRPHFPSFHFVRTPNLERLQTLRGEFIADLHVSIARLL
jgi:hypothetical protein